MQLLLIGIYIIHVLVSIFLVLVVLLQQGQGADLAVFGGGSTQAAFGARSATTVLHKLTVGGFIIFILTTLSVAILQNRAASGSSVIPAAAAAPLTQEADDASATAAGEVEEPVATEATADPNGDGAPATGGDAGPDDEDGSTATDDGSEGGSP